MRENSGQLTGIISAAAFSFIVQDPSGIIAVSSPKILALERADVPHHLGLRVMRVEHRVRQERGRRGATTRRQRRPRQVLERADRRGRPSALNTTATSARSHSVTVSFSEIWTTPGAG